MRTRFTSTFCGLMLVLLGASSASYSATATVAVPGSASRTVTTDELSIVLALPTEGESFADAEREADDLVQRITSRLDSDFPGRVQIDRQVAALRQKRISWSSKAKKLDHRVTIRIGGFQDDLPGEAVAILDALLALDSRLEATDMEGRLSDDKAANVRAELLVAALRDAHRKADALAKEAGYRVQHLRVVNAAPGYRSSGYGDFIAESIVVQSRAFRMTADLMGAIEMSVQLVAEYETVPTN